jgi:hypothetical protein
MPTTSPYLITLTPEERSILEAGAREYTSPYGYVMRARLVLLAAEGCENAQIGRALGMPRQVVSKWRQRFFRERIAGLEDLPRRGRPPGSSPSGRGAGRGSGL